MKRIEIQPQRTNQIYLFCFLVVASWIIFLVGKELFFPAPPLPIIDVASERIKIERAGLKLYEGRFYRVTGEEEVK